MPKIQYRTQKFNAASLAHIQVANQIINEYAGEGYDLTLRQLYYQFVSRNHIRNTAQEYKRLGELVNNARLAGLIDWIAITDRTRNLQSNPHWDDPASIIEVCARQFRVDLWEGQEARVELWVEKDALAGVFDRVCRDLDVPLFACRGYTSQSEMWAAGQRLQRYNHNHQHGVILHFGDHDPSGVDMTRDILDRLVLFAGRGNFTLDRIALTMEQVTQNNLPPNPTKMTDSRSTGYVDEFGEESWELDALDPAALAQLARTAIQRHINQRQWQDALDRQEDGRRLLTLVSEAWERLTEGM